MPYLAGAKSGLELVQLLMDGLACDSRLDGSPIASREIRRVKTGCYTCKSRKVKCDEQRPACWRCISTGRECSGYGIWDGGYTGGRPTTQCLNTYRPNNMGAVGRLDAQGRRILEWTLHAQFEGIFPFPYWETLIPQTCHNEPVILDCVLALGCIHQRACITKQPTNSQDRIDSLESDTLRYYNRAIGSLNSFRRSSSRLNGSRTHAQVILIACLTFIIIEYLQNHPKKGLLHLEHGLRILRSREYKSIRHSSRDLVDDWLADAFDRLDIQARPLLKATALNQHYTHDSVDSQCFPSIGSLREARQQLDSLISEAYRLQYSAHNAIFSADVSLLFQALSIQQRLQRCLSSWLRAYRAWCIRPLPFHEPPLSPPEQVARHLLLLYHTMIGIMTATALYMGDESVFDQHTEGFASIVTSAKELFEIYNPTTRRLATSHNHCSEYFTFTSDLGLIPVLYYTAIKCRDEQIRRNALSILETKTRQEGIWEGSTAALIAAEVIRLETPYPEQDEATHNEKATSKHRKSITLDSHFPPSWRIFDIGVELPDNPEMELVLSYKRRLKNGAWDPLERRYSGGKWY